MRLKRFGCAEIYFFCFIVILGASEAETRGKLTTATSLAINHFGLFKSTVNFVYDARADVNLINEILRKSQTTGCVTMKITNSEKSVKSSTERNSCNVIVVKEIAVMIQLVETLSSKVYDRHGYFLVAVFDAVELKDMEKLFLLVWKARIINFSLIYKDKSSISMTTFTPFTHQSCGENLTLITRNFEPEIGKMFANKLTDLKNCPVRVTTFHLRPFVMKEGSELIGRDVLLMKALSRALRFKLDVEFLEGNIPWGYLLDNGTGTGAIAKLLNNETDIIVGDYFLKMDRLKFFDSSKPYFESQFAFIIPPPSKFASFEKLFQPFKLAVWIALIVCCVIGVSVILLINRSSQHIKALVYGEKTKTPLTNMLLVILGGSQPNVPTKFFARFILMLFIIFTLVMRSIYLGSMFKFLQSDESHSEVKSVDDMMEKNFKFHIGKSFHELIQEESNIYQR